MYDFLKRKLHKFIRRNFYAEIWNIAFIEANIEAILDKDFTKLDAKWLPKQKNFHYLADPFFCKENGHILLFVEDFSYYDKKGKVKLLKLDQNYQILDEKIILKDKSHYSYPFIYKENGHFYMLPENSSADELSIYTTKNPWAEWQKTQTIFSKQKLIDATLLYHDKTYWLFYNTKSDIHGSNSELHIAYSDSLDKNFTFHPQNPIKIDISSSRPAGKILEINNKLYRPAQDCSKSYGGALVINEIVKLTKTEYTEKTVNQIEPISSSYPDGIHTINYEDGLFVIDGKKYEFHLHKILVNLYRRIRKIL